MININLLPKNLRQRQESGYWRLIALVFPLLVLAVIAFIQISANQTEQQLQLERDLREAQLDSLRPFLEQQRALQQRQQELSELINIRNAVFEGRIAWTSELINMLETLPPPSEGQSVIEFSQLTMQSLDTGARDQRVNNVVYEGARPFAEMSVQGTARSAADMANYVRALEVSELFGVSFQNAARDNETGHYSFNLTVGALEQGGSE